MGKGLQKMQEGINLIAGGMESEGIQVSTSHIPAERKKDALNQHRLGSEKRSSPFAISLYPLNSDLNLERPPSTDNTETRPRFPADDGNENDRNAVPGKSLTANRKTSSSGQLPDSTDRNRSTRTQRGPDDKPHQQYPNLEKPFLHQLKLLEKSLEQLAASKERNSDAITELTEKLGNIDTNLGSFDGLRKCLELNFRTLTRSAHELVDGKPAFAGLIHLNHSSKYDEKPDVWQGITLHAQDRPFTVRVLMQNIQTAISNLHPDKPTKGIELTEVSFVWDNNEKKRYRGGLDGNRAHCILGRGEPDESILEDALVSNSLETMMVRGNQGYIYVKYCLDKVEHAEWCGREKE
ncbi:hypothetical protein EAF04_005753 [Stromatinia cepivora]|nr:hypothetical protein EAF04_005753 [Stromatinia cepivora]